MIHPGSRRGSGGVHPWAIFNGSSPLRLPRGLMSKEEARPGDKPGTDLEGNALPWRQ